MSTDTVIVNPKMLTWARERAGMDTAPLVRRFPKLAEWEAGKLKPTLRQLENFARTVHVPIGYLFLPKPVQETIPVADFRTTAEHTVVRPGPNLLDTLYLCQQRQDWYREYARMSRFPALDFIGSAATGNDPALVAGAIRKKLRFSPAEHRQLRTWTETLRLLMTGAEEVGVLVMGSSIIGSNNCRKLNVDEFRGIALADNLAPLIFLNTADSKAAQMFTVAHELAHLWLGQSGVSNTEAGRLPAQTTERWCNAVAAELLMPMDDTREAYRPDLPVPEEIRRLAQMFKVSTLVALRRLFDAAFIDADTLRQHYLMEQARIRAQAPRNSGGDFYRTLGARTGKRFARAILASALEGQTLFQDAFRLLGVKKSATFYSAARELGVMS
jgi:Zn-dependent peptidase ImmA (M78 family)